MKEYCLPQCACYRCKGTINEWIGRVYDNDLMRAIFKKEKNMVDLSKAKVGQIAHFRCGGSAKIVECADNMISFNKGIGGGTDWWSHSFLSQDLTPFAIVILEDPPFEWKDVKPGMAFKAQHGCTLMRFIGRKMNGTLVFEDKYGSIETCSAGDVSRLPEYDQL